MTNLTNTVFEGFTQTDFDTFHIEGLEARMEAIRSRIQPKFQAIGETLTGNIAAHAGNEMFVHIAQHARRTVNPPKDTWMAFCHNKRGYKKHPHFQIGLFDDRVFVWFALIYELPNKQGMAKQFLKNESELLNIIPRDYVISDDHMHKEAVAMNDLDETSFRKLLVRFRDVKKAEFLVGKHFEMNDPLLADGQAFLGRVEEIYTTLMPLYRKSFV